jgi:hypothetical protein
MSLAHAAVHSCSYFISRSRSLGVHVLRRSMTSALSATDMTRTDVGVLFGEPHLMAHLTDERIGGVAGTRELEPPDMVRVALRAAWECRRARARSEHLGNLPWCSADGVPVQ